jgi:hypothetical protein
MGRVAGGERDADSNTRSSELQAAVAPAVPSALSHIYLGDDVRLARSVVLLLDMMSLYVVRYEEAPKNEAGCEQLTRQRLR